ncbi:protein spaetzle 4 isoform X3 [Eurytemora carolleeae]|uniref:protein spaetzle 4 isoform X3 n=1 Tax=Eurytemora carolleeae TaxID=1294199 RepID=UPI000C76151F|nr:protein spaetzle 4 isoform X3 [Eurytemora carolleeae]|eukprot:XP_023349455.1 protein spaetzle 4-like isoform X3 [Eurytemora affinis]
MSNNVRNLVFLVILTSMYNRNAIWRFKEENKALMRRLYGDVDSTEVYREMRSNDLFGDDFSKKGRWGTKKDESSVEKQELTDREDRSSSYAVNMLPFSENMFNDLQYNIRVGSGLAMIKNAKIEDIGKRKPETRTRTRSRTTRQTTQRTVVTVESSTSYTTSRVATTHYSATTDVPSTQETVPVQIQTVQPAIQQPLQTVQQQTIQPTTADSAESIATTTEQPQTTFFTVSEDMSTLPFNPDTPSADAELREGGTDPGVLLQDEVEPADQDGQDQFEEVDQSQDYIEDDYPSTTDITDSLEAVLNNLQPHTQEDITISQAGEIIEQALAHDLEIDEEETDQDFEDDLTEEDEDLEDNLEEELSETEEDDFPLENKYTGDSVNACPVYEEVKAPYWANNTRNQVLALLNLYPFEQYIHIEKCKYEGEEMLCRPGCRCEQQYRLHRLLAFDPSNECRGIFSDWFRFPSFCLCKCYNVPEQILESMRVSKQLEMSSDRRKSSSKKHSGPGPTHNSPQARLGNHRMSKENKLEELKHKKEYKHENNFPAVFPYEGKAAIMAELNRVSGIVPGSQGYSENQEMNRVSGSQGYLQNEVLKTELNLDEFAEEHIDNMVDSQQSDFRKTNKEARNLEDHFFYNNPILEFKLPDGTVGSVNSPRK